VAGQRPRHLGRRGPVVDGLADGDVAVLFVFHHAAADALGFAAIASLAAAIVAGTATFDWIAAVAVVEGTAGLAFRTAEAGALPRVVPREQLGDAVAANQAREYGAFLAGPPLGGVLFGLDRAAPFVADAASFVLSAAAAAAVRTPLQEERTTPRRHLLIEAREGVAWLWRVPFLRTSELLVACANFATNAVSLTLILVAKHQGASSALVGVMLAIVGAGGLAGSVAAPRLRKLVAARAIVVGYAWVGVAILLGLLTMPAALVLGALFGGWVFFGPLWDSVVIGYRLAIVPDALQGRVESVGAAIAFGGGALGSLAAGLAYAAVGGRATIAALAGWTLALAVVGSVSPSLRRVEAA
jgi:hypothetical protein